MATDSSTRGAKERASSSDQRDLLEQSECEAASEQPRNFQGESAADKVVSTERRSQDEPGDIRGLDNDEGGQPRGSTSKGRGS